MELLPQRACESQKGGDTLLFCAGHHSMGIGTFGGGLGGYATHTGDRIIMDGQHGHQDPTVDLILRTVSATEKAQGRTEMGVHVDEVFKRLAGKMTRPVFDDAISRITMEGLLYQAGDEFHVRSFEE